MAIASRTSGMSSLCIRQDTGATTLGVLKPASVACLLLTAAVPVLAAEAPSPGDDPALCGIPIAYILFGLTLLGVVLLHHYTLQVALTGLAGLASGMAYSLFKAKVHMPGNRIHRTRRTRKGQRPFFRWPH